MLFYNDNDQYNRFVSKAIQQIYVASKVLQEVAHVLARPDKRLTNIYSGS